MSSADLQTSLNQPTLFSKIKHHQPDGLCGNQVFVWVVHLQTSCPLHPPLRSSPPHPDPLLSVRRSHFLPLKPISLNSRLLLCSLITTLCDDTLVAESCEKNRWHIQRWEEMLSFFAQIPLFLPGLRLSSTARTFISVYQVGVTPGFFLLKKKSVFRCDTVVENSWVNIQTSTFFSGSTF